MQNIVLRKQGRKVITVFFFVFIVLFSACGQPVETNSPSSPVPSEAESSPTWTASAATITPQPTGTPEPATSIPFSYLTPTPIFTPSLGADSYRLKEWNEAAALGLVEIAEQFSFANNIPMPIGDRRFNYQVDQSAIRLAAQEALHRFSDTSYREKLEWRIALADTIMDSSTSDVWILKALEDALNNGGITPNTLEKIITPYGFEISQREPAPNLLGDGQTAYVIWITTQDQGAGPTGLYAAIHQDTQGNYTISRIYSSWGFTIGSDNPFQIGEHTGDGIPEVILSPGYNDGSFCGYELLLFQWHGDHFADLSQGQFQFDLCGFYEESWKYVSNAQKPVESIELQRPADFLAHVIRHEQFDWNGEQYVLKKSWLETPVKLDRPASNWVIHAMNEGEYQTVLEKVGEFTSDSNQVRTMMSQFGTRYPDYLRFQLALAHAFQSNETEARSILEQIIQKPQDTASLTLSHAAQAYLEKYRGQADLYISCQSALQVMDKALGAPSLRAGTENPEQMEKAWGYQPDDSWDSLALCNLSTAFEAITSQLASSDFAQAPEELTKAGVLIRSSAEVDLDGNGRSEWVLLVDTPGDDAPLAIWILLDTGEDVRALPLVPWQRKQFDLPSGGIASAKLNVETILSPEGKATDLIQVGTLLYVFQLNSQERSIDQLLVTVRDVESYSILRQNDRLILEVTTWTENCQDCKELYAWIEDGFEWVFPGDPDKSRVIEAEKTLLDSAKYEEATLLLQDILNDSSYRESPRLLYLLSLAYELAGEEDQAVHTYWHLWYNHSDSVYARLAQAKLESIK